jgi:four helix bundle protein
MIELSHKKMEVWKFSVELVKEIYLLTRDFPNNEIYGLTSQLRRAAISIPSNLSEGLSRNSSKEKARYIDIARSSLVELDTQIEIAIMLEYCSEKSIEKIGELSNSIFGMLTSLLKKYQ